jgi:NhaP-type Na+/H+ or K+/H+ antiporter
MIVDKKYDDDDDDDDEPATVDDDQQTTTTTTTVAQSLLSFSPQVFFLVLLPPIIFNSGYHLRKELFFRHITPICLLAVMGTTVSAISIAAFLQVVCHYGQACGGGGDDDDDFAPLLTELLTFGALISATDPVSTLAVFQAKRVDPQLFYLVFGESVLNDAVGLVLFNAFSQFVVRDNGAGKVAIGIGEFIIGFLYDSIGSPVLGLVLGLCSAYVFKIVDMRRTKLLELCLYVMIMYVPFLLATMLKLSGIVTILVTGMAAKNYVVPNLSVVTADNAEVFFRLAAHLAETSIFLELGLSVSGLLFAKSPSSSLQNTVPFILWSLVACLLGRALNVYPIAFLFNRRLRRTEGHDLICSNSIDDDASPGRNSSSRSPLYQQSPDQRCHPHKRRVNSQSSTPEQLELSRVHHHEENADDDDQDGRKMKYVVAPCLSASPPRHLSPSSKSDASSRSRHSSVASLSPPGLERNDTSQSSVQTTTPRVRRDLRILPNTMHMLWFSGLRGAVAYACVRSFPDTFGHANEFTVTTMVIVLVTVFCLGSTTECALSILHIEQNVDEDLYMENWHRERQEDGLILRFEDFILQYVVRSPTTGIVVDREDEAAAAAGGGRDAAGGPIGTTSPHRHSTPSLADCQRNQYEMTESSHLENMERDCSSHRGRRRESVFDYGGDSRDWD